MKNKPQAVWDLPVRLLHWTLVAAIATAWITRHDRGPAHEIAGYLAASTVALRLLWSFVGNRYARFGQFVRPASATLQYFHLFRQQAAPRYIGHNPLGGWMVVALLGMVGLLAATGWSLDTDLLWGYAWPVDIHVALAWTLLGLVALHVGGVLLSSLLHRENLVAAMLTGKKAGAQPGDID